MYHLKATLNMIVHDPQLVLLNSIFQLAMAKYS